MTFQPSDWNLRAVALPMPEEAPVIRMLFKFVSSGVQVEHVTIACSQALLPFFLPQQIAAYRNAHPGVTFAVNVRDREQAEAELVSFRSDLALVFEPRVLVDFEVLHAIPQPVCALFARDHPLAGRSELRLRDCLDHPHIAPAQKYGVRGLLDMAANRFNTGDRGALYCTWDMPTSAQEVGGHRTRELGFVGRYEDEAR